MTPLTNGALARLTTAEGEVTKLRDRTDTLTTQNAIREQEVKEVKNDIQRLEEALKNNTRATWALVVSILLAALTIGSSVLVVVSH